MKFGNGTVAGIDISQERISIALLRDGKDGPELVKSVVAPMPEGAVRDGNIADMAILSKAIKDLRFHNRIWARRAAVSLFARPVVLQIIDMPQQVPSNIRQFVNNEVKNCVVLPGRDITLDFYGVGSGRKSADRKVFAVAAESSKMVELIRAFGKAGLTVESIEPPLLAYLRAVYSQKIAGKNKCNVLVAVLQGTDSAGSPHAALTLCVLKNGEIDFVRSKEFAENSADSDSVNRWLADELSEVVRFYDIETPENAGKWDVAVFVDSSQPQGAVEECLKSRIQSAHLQVRAIQDAYMDMPASISSAAKDMQPSPVAVGLAMKLLTKQPTDLKINLIPSQVLRAREAKRDALIAANVVGAMLLIMLLAINGFGFMIGRTTRNTISKGRLIAEHDTEMMTKQDRRLDTRLNALSGRLDRIAQISASHRDVNWIEVLEEVRKATPGSVRINNLSSQDGLRVQIQGLAMSNEAVSLFVSLLEKSQLIVSVTLLDTQRQNEQSGIITYQIICKLGKRSAKTEDVS